MQEQLNDYPIHIPHFHKHYIGAAQSFEIILPKDPKYDYRPDVTILKTFFIDDTLNENDWLATWEGLKLDAEELPGIPLVLQEDLEHPTYSVQKYFDRGTIFDFDIDEENHKIIVYIRVTDPTITERIKSGELQYVSPAVIPRGSEYLRNVNGKDVLDRTIPLHLAIVSSPAYGKHKALMTHICSGDGTACYNRLKMMTAGIVEVAQSDECVSRKISIIKREKPTISDEQAAAIAYSMCRRGTAEASPNSGIKSDLKVIQAEIPALEQIPFIKKMVAKLARTASILEQTRFGMKYPIHNGREGHWIAAKGMDVFVARNQSIKEALLNQCGCTKLGATEGKISKEKADYHDTDSKEKNCSTCRFFNYKEEACQVVEGKIESNYISDLWQSKK